MVSEVEVGAAESEPLVGQDGGEPLGGRDGLGDLQWPDLFLIDGGLGQVHAALQGLADAGVVKMPPLVGLAKREEEIIVPGRAEPVRLSRRAAALKLLQALRDEAHRFAITFQRDSRKETLKVLQGIEELPGFGPATHKKVVKQYGTEKSLRAASEAELVALLGAAKAGALREWLDRGPTT